MAKFISKIVGEEILQNGQKRSITNMFLVDENGKILHDKSREEDAEGVTRRIEVEAHKVAIRKGMTLRTRELNGEGHETGKWKYNALFHEEFPGTMDQAEKEISKEMEIRDQVEKEVKKKMDQAGKSK